MLLHAFLVVDDRDQRRAIRESLESRDVMTAWVRGSALLQRLKDERVDLLILPAALLEQWPELSVAVLQSRHAPLVVGLTEQGHMKGAIEGVDALMPLDARAEERQATLGNIVARRRAQSHQPRRLGDEPSLDDFATQSTKMLEFVRLVRRVVASRATLLVLGETGVGKERLARAVHAESPRRGSRFVAVNCGALPESLLESELFGHERGAFTGAVRERRGCFELADGGTLFLDEIGEIPPHLQVKLLRALQDREVTRIGGETPKPIDVRIIAATNRDLEEEVVDGRFRRDLYYRLNVVTLEIPPLRERVEEIPGLADAYLEYLSAQIGYDGIVLTPAAVEVLVQYQWPGNIRELINVLERAILLSDGEPITPALLPMGQPDSALPEGRDVRRVGEIDDELFAMPLPAARRIAADRFEVAYLREVLTRAKGRIGVAAAHAGIAPRSLYTRMQRLGLNKSQFRC